MHDAGSVTEALRSSDEWDKATRQHRTRNFTRFLGSTATSPQSHREAADGQARQKAPTTVMRLSAKERYLAGADVEKQ